MSDAYKNAQRATMKGVRLHASVHYRHKASHRICARIRALPAYRQAKNIAFYDAFSGEVDVSSLWHTSPLHGKFCFFPILNDDLSLSFLPATPATHFKKNRFGIHEPDLDKSLAISTQELDLVMVPTVAFDPHGNRLGMGKGCYDRTFANKGETILLGVAYAFQKVSLISKNPWDITLDAIVTQEGVYTP